MQAFSSATNRCPTVRIKLTTFESGIEIRQRNGLQACLNSDSTDGGEENYSVKQSIGS